MALQKESLEMKETGSLSVKIVVKQESRTSQRSVRSVQEACHAALEEKVSL